MTLSNLRELKMGQTLRIKAEQDGPSKTELLSTNIKLIADMLISMTKFNETLNRASDEVKNQANTATEALKKIQLLMTDNLSAEQAKKDTTAKEQL